MSFKKILANRKLRYGSFATVLSIGFLVVIVLLNVIASIVVEKFPLKLDLTKDSIFMLTDESIDYIKGLDKDVDIIVLADESTWTSAGSYYAQAIEVINKYAQYNTKIKVSYVDLVKNPTFTADYPDLELSPNKILVKSGNKSRVMTSSDLFNIQTSQYYGSYIASSKAEQAMTSAIMAVTSDETIRISVLSGHDETDASDFISLLEQNNYEVKMQNLVTEDIDPECDVAIMIAPKRDMDEDILKKLDKFLNNDEKLGKNLLYFADVTQPAMPNLEAFLKEWGIEVQEGSVFQTDTSKIIYYNPYFAVLDYANDEVAGSLKDRGLYVSLPFSRPLSQAYTERNGFYTSVLLQFNEKAGVRPNDASETFVPSADMASGPIPGMIMSTKQTYVNNERLRSNVVVSGSSTALEGTMLQSTSLTNGEYLINLLNMLTERKDVISIAPKQLGGSELNITAGQVNALGITFMAVVPLAVIIVGLVIWLRRRHL